MDEEDEDSVDDEREEDCEELGSLELLLDASSLAFTVPASKEPLMQMAMVRSNSLCFIVCLSLNVSSRLIFDAAAWLVVTGHYCTVRAVFFPLKWGNQPLCLPVAIASKTKRAAPVKESLRHVVPSTHD